MNLKLLACLACSAALLVGACSGNNTGGTASGSSGNGDTGTDGNGNGGAGNGNGNGDSNGAASIESLRLTALNAVRAAATAAATAETGTAADRVRARNAIGEARRALDAVVQAAEDAQAAAAGGSAAAVGAAARAITSANNFKMQQTGILDRALTSFAWFGDEIVRTAIPNGAVRVPRETTTNADGEVVSRATITRTPRTRDTSASDNTQVANPDAIKSTSFSAVMYEAGKVLLSGGGRKASPTVTDDEFKVDGTIFGMSPTSPLDTATLTGLKLTNTGLAIRIGGTRAAADGATMTDYTDMRKKVTETVDTDRGDEGTVATLGENGWDLAIAFDEPQPTSFPGIQDVLTSWQGNGDFYWRGIVNADESQLSSSGANYDSTAFTQPKTPRDFRDLGTYEVWLSNHIGIDKNLEPTAGQIGTCPDGVRRTACPKDDENLYLSYAAYGLFTYKADTETAAADDRKNRVQSMYFGYQAFANEDGQKTEDISKAISSGTFTGQTLATVIEANSKTTLLRGNVSLTVSIPKDSGTGSVHGTLDGFEEWAGTNWKPYSVASFSVRLDNGTANTGTTIMPDGSYTGTATAKRRSPPSAASGVGVFKGNFYGPRTDADLETAGSWDVGRDWRGATKIDCRQLRCQAKGCGFKQLSLPVGKHMRRLAAAPNGAAAFSFSTPARAQRDFDHRNPIACNRAEIAAIASNCRGGPFESAHSEHIEQAFRT